MKNLIGKSSRFFSLLLVALNVSGCAIGLGRSIHEYGQLDHEKITTQSKSKKIESIGTQTVILFFSFDTDYADEAYKDFLGKCRQGRIVNVRSIYSTELGFFAYKNKLRILGDCIESS